MSPEDVVYDLVGLGFGPANIAIAGALTEKWQQDVVSSTQHVVYRHTNV